MGATGWVMGMGNACFDTFVELAHWPQPGDKQEILRQSESVGGQVAGAMAGLARLGVATEFLLRTGDDDAGKTIHAALQAAGVGLRRARTIAGCRSARAVILRSHDGERSVLWDTPSDLVVEPDEIVPEVLANASALFFDGRDGAACAWAARRARGLGIPVIADLDHHYPHTAELLPLIDHLIVPAAMGEVRGASVTVITQGAEGCEAFAPAGERLRVPAFPIKVVDTTGAGDAFHAGYVYALLRGSALRERLQFAGAAAALACRGLGTLASLPTRDEVEALMAASHTP